MSVPLWDQLNGQLVESIGLLIRLFVLLSLLFDLPNYRCNAHWLCLMRLEKRISIPNANE